MWFNKAEKNYLYVNKIVFLCNEFGKMILGVEKNIIFFFSFESSRNKLSGTGFVFVLALNKKK